jgi:hypothetical protein
MAKRRKRKHGARSTPDDYFAAGPLEFARFGRLMLARSNYSDREFAELQVRLAARFPHVVQEIDELIAQLVELVRVLPPEELLKRAWWLLTSTHLGIEAEASVGREQMMAMRMVDYLQSLIASVPPRSSRRSEVTDGEWESLERLVSTLFNKLNTEYQVCRTAKSRAEDPSLNMELEEFRAKAEVFWCSVRGKRYAVHEPQALADLLVPHTGAIEALFGITASQLIAELSKVQRSLTFGVQATFESLFALQRDMLGPITARAQGEDPNDSMALLMSKAMADEGLRARAEAMLGKLHGLDLFDLEKITNLPQALLDELSWSEGQDTEFFSEGEHRGWPLRVWPVFKRPFIKLNGRYYCFDLFSLFDNFYRVMQRVIFRLKPDYRNEWNRIQKEVSERLPFEYLAKLLPGARAYHAVYYRAHAGDGGTKQWYEADGLIVFDDHLFVIEVKAGAFTYTSPATDLPAHINSLKALVLSPATQGHRFVDYLESKDEVQVFDDEHCLVGTLRRRDFRQVTVCAITLDVFTELASQAQHLRQIGINVGDRPLWSLSVDDLRVYADVFDNPLVFLHFVEQRMRAARSPLVKLTDELDHLGLYLQHNNYAQYATEVLGSGTGSELNFVGYRSPVDTYFAAKLQGEEPLRPLEQEIPRRMAELLAFLASSNTPKRAELASLLLDMAGETRKAIAEGIDTQMQSASASGRSRPLSTHGDVRLTVFCWTPQVARSEAGALEHARAAMLASGETDRVLLELTYTDAGVLHEVHWQRVSLSGLSEDVLAALQETAEALRTARLLRAKRTEGKIGRNVQCPCGSGKKYKRCCLR